MKTLLSITLVFLAIFTASAAEVKISDLTEIASPSDNTWILVSDMDAATKSRKHRFTNLVARATFDASTNAIATQLALRGTNMMVSTITYGTTISPTFAIGGLSTTAASARRVTFRLTLTGNVTAVDAPAGTLIDGDTMVWEMIQDGSGSHTITGWDAKYAFGADITGITLTTTASKRDFITFTYNSTADKWYCVGFVRGY